MIDGVRVIQAPLAGGASTSALAAAVCEAGGLGFLAAGYKKPEAVEEEIAELRAADRSAVRAEHLRAAR